MISYEEAFSRVMSEAKVLPAESTPLADACGRVLSEDVAIDMDMPPFDKSAMDGYACRKRDLPGPLRVVEVIQAGMEPRLQLGVGECAKIMTGAKVPKGADWVVMVEECRVEGDGRVVVTGAAATGHICFQGEDLRTGDTLLRRGVRLEPRHIALLAMAGCVAPRVVRAPRIGIIATGEELVEPDTKPGICQIRNSNSWQLRAQVREASGDVRYYGIVGDVREDLDRTVRQALEECDVLLLSGGVSMGDYDYVPEVMSCNGIRIFFDSIAMQPGKPTTFGVGNGAYCFGLPGNPVSTFLQCEILVKPLLYALMGAQFSPPWETRMLSETYKRKKTERQGWIPVRDAGRGCVRPMDFHGSAHISALAEASGFMIVPIGVSGWAVGDSVNVWCF